MQQILFEHIADGLDAAAHAARSLRLFRPNRLDNPYDHRGVNVAHSDIADHRICVRAECVAPLLYMLAVSPMRFLQMDKRFGRLTECQVGTRRDLSNRLRRCSRRARIGPIRFLTMSRYSVASLRASPSETRESSLMPVSRTRPSSLNRNTTERTPLSSIWI